MSKCTGCATYASTFKGDSTSCLLDKLNECVCMTCLIKVVCTRKLECMDFCRQALLIHNAHDSGFIRCLKNMFPETYQQLMKEKRITLTKKEIGMPPKKVICIEGKRLVVDQIHSYFHDREDHEIIVYCMDQAFNFVYSSALMKSLDDYFDVHIIN